jgi:hypothetical protein
MPKSACPLRHAGDQVFKQDSAPLRLRELPQVPGRRHIGNVHVLTLLRPNTGTFQPVMDLHCVEAVSLSPPISLSFPLPLSLFTGRSASFPAPIGPTRSTLCTLVCPASQAMPPYHGTPHLPFTATALCGTHEHGLRTGAHHGGSRPPRE